MTLSLDLSHPGTYLDWGVLSISVANAVVILLMLLLFGLALLLPFPKDREHR